MTSVTARALVAACAGLALFAGPAHADTGPETINVTVPQTGTVSCTGADGTALGANPSLTPGTTINCTITGLGANEQVTVALDTAGNTFGTITADGNGSATYSFTVLADLSTGAHSLIFTGQTSKTVATFPFTVVTGAAGGGSGGGSGGSGGGGGGLAFTGVDVFGLVGGATVLLTIGGVLTGLGRRRRRA